MVFAILGASGTRILSRVKRFQTYIDELHGKEYGNVKELAQRIRKKEKFVVKDLEYMIQKRWFLQGYLDEQKVCLMTSREAYGQYQELMEQAKQQKVWEQSEKEKADADAGRRAAMDPKVQEVIETGNAYIFARFGECNDAIPGEAVSEKISRMELLTKRIFEQVEQNPETVTDIRRLMEYYFQQRSSFWKHIGWMHSRCRGTRYSVFEKGNRRYTGYIEYSI